VNKSDLAAEIAQRAGFSKIDANKAIDSVFGAITDALKNGDEVRLVGFGTFYVKDRPESEGRNPRTKEKITIPAARQPKFKPGKSLKDELVVASEG